MFHSRFFLYAIFVLSTFGGCAAIPKNDIESQKLRFARPIDKVLDGQWEGTLKKREPLTSPDPTKPPVSDDVNLRVMVDGWTAKVFLLESGKWIEVMPDSFKIMRYSTNATAIAINASGDEQGGWVESWAILMTVKNDDEILTEWTRVVNNLGPAEPTVAQTFSMGAVGRMHRIEP